MIVDADPVYFLLKGPSFPLATECDRMVGRIVRNFAQPIGDDYFPEDASQFREEKYKKLDETVLGSATRFAGAEHDGGIRGTLLSFIDGHHKSSIERKRWLEATKIHAFDLRKPRDVFQRLRKQPETIKQMRAWQSRHDHIESSDVPGYLVVGVLAWESAQLVETETSGRSTGVDIALPTGAAASAAIAGTTGIVVDPRAIGDVGGGLSKNSTSEIARAADIDDGRIFAIRCLNIRKVRRNMFAPASYELESRGPRIPEDRKYGEIPSQRETTNQPSVQDTSGRVGMGTETELELEVPSDVLWTDVVYDFDEDAEIQEEVIEVDGNKFRLVSWLEQ